MTVLHASNIVMSLIENSIDFSFFTLGEITAIRFILSPTTRKSWHFSLVRSIVARSSLQAPTVKQAVFCRFG